MLGGVDRAWEWAALGLLAVSIVAPAYAYFGYPLLLLALRGLRRAPEASDLPDEALPALTMAVAAYNEEAVIGAKVANFLESDYPPERLTLLVGSDGSDDGTVAAARAAAGGSGRVVVTQFAERRGKASVVNDLVAQCRGPIIVLSDANTIYEPSALRKLVRHFAEPAVGAVCGRLVLTADSAGASREEGLYWRYETLLKRLESDAGCLTSINGQVLAFRRELYEPLPADSLTEDQHLGLRILARGRLIRFEPDAVVTEPVGALETERARRLRISTGNFQTLFCAGLALLSPAKGFPALAYVSHKVLRWMVPLFMAAALVANAALLGVPAARWLFAAQAAFYAAAAAPAVTPGLARCRVLRVANYFAVMNLEIARGFFRWAFGRHGGMWQRTARA